MRKFIFTSSVFLSALVSLNAYSNPPGSWVRDLRILSDSGLGNTDIYANGNMQAALDIIYDLEPGYSLKSVTLKKYNTGQDLDDWEQSSLENKYLHNIGGQRIGHLRSSKFVQRYLSTSSPRSVSVCVELTATKEGQDFTTSTCEPGTNQASVFVNAINPVYLTKNNFELLPWDISSEIDDYEYQHTLNQPTGILTQEIKEQVLRKTSETPAILDIEVDHLLSESTSTLYLQDSLISKYGSTTPTSDDPYHLSHIMAWAVLPNMGVNKIKYVESTGWNNFNALTLEKNIPYAFKSDPNYLFSIITEIMRLDRGKYQAGYKSYLNCSVPGASSNTTIPCNMLTTVGSSDVEVYDSGVVASKSISRNSSAIKVTDYYGTESNIIMGVRKVDNYLSVIELF